MHESIEPELREQVRGVKFCKTEARRPTWPLETGCQTAERSHAAWIFTFGAKQSASAESGAGSGAGNRGVSQEAACPIPPPLRSYPSANPLGICRTGQPRTCSCGAFEGGGGGKGVIKEPNCLTVVTILASACLVLLAILRTATSAALPRNLFLRLPRFFSPCQCCLSSPRVGRVGFDGLSEFRTVFRVFLLFSNKCCAVPLDVACFVMFKASRYPVQSEYCRIFNFTHVYSWFICYQIVL